MDSFFQLIKYTYSSIFGGPGRATTHCVSLRSATYRIIQTVRQLHIDHEFNLQCHRFDRIERNLAMVRDQSPYMIWTYPEEWNANLPRLQTGQRAL